MWAPLLDSVRRESLGPAHAQREGIAQERGYQEVGINREHLKRLSPTVRLGWNLVAGKQEFSDGSHSFCAAGGCFFCQGLWREPSWLEKV